MVNNNIDSGSSAGADINNGSTAIDREPVISDIMQTQTAYKESEAPIRLIADTAPVLIWRSGADSMFDYFNQTWLDFTGRSLEQELGYGWASGIHPEDLERYHGIYLDAFRQHIKFRMEFRLKDKDGRYHWVLDNGVPRFTSDGIFTGYIGTCVDITENKIVEERLRNLTKAVEQSPVSILITDLKGNIEYVNPKAIETTGYTYDELLGKNPRLLKSGETANEEYQFLWESISRGNHWEGVFHNKRKNGELYWESARVAPIIDEYGKVTSFLAVKEDITEKKRIEDALRASEEKYRILSEELREMNATKDKLFSIIGHDMRGPVGNFNHVLDVLTGEPGLDEEMKNSLLEELKGSSKNIFNLLDNLLNWSMIQRSLINIVPRHFIINDSIRRNIDLLQPNANQKKINLVLQGDRDLKVYADSDSIDLVIRNLLSNAIKFTVESGTITISVSHDEKQATISVEDTGVGMKKEVLDTLFRSASYYSTYGTNGEKGSGIGLVLVKDFVQRNGGEIRVESEPGEGSRFIFTLPLDQLPFQDI
jgi:PAS domain S-box-containing protein